MNVIDGNYSIFQMTGEKTLKIFKGRDLIKELEAAPNLSAMDLAKILDLYKREILD